MSGRSVRHQADVMTWQPYSGPLQCEDLLRTLTIEESRVDE